MASVGVSVLNRNTASLTRPIQSLLTIVLVQIVDVLVNHVPLTLFSVLGGSLIILGFVLLVIT